MATGGADAVWSSTHAAVTPLIESRMNSPDCWRLEPLARARLQHENANDTHLVESMPATTPAKEPM